MNREPSLFRLARRSFWLLFGGIWLVVGLPFAITGGWMAWQEARFRTEAERTQAVVLTKDINRATSKKSTSYHVTYRFTTDSGQVIEGSSKLDFGDWERLEEEGPVDVEYLRSRPATNRVVGSSEWTGALAFAGLGGAFAGVGGFLFFRDLRKIFWMRRLWREGAATQGSVTAVEETNVSINRVPQWRLRYRYRDHVGQTHEALSGYLSPAEAEAWQVGETGAVRFDPNRPETSFWIGRE